MNRQTTTVTMADGTMHVFESCPMEEYEALKARFDRVSAYAARLATNLTEARAQGGHAACECGRIRDLLDEARAELAKMNREKYPFVHLRFDVSGAEVESALRAKLVELGWTPPADLPLPAAAPADEGGVK